MRTVFREITPALDASFTIRQEQAAQFAAPFHFHRGYELVLIVKGQGKFYGGTQVLNFADGDLYLFGPNFPHYFVNERTFVESGAIAHSIFLQFRDDALEGALGHLPELQAVNKLLKLAVAGIKFSAAEAPVRQFFVEMAKQKSAGLPALLQFLHLLHQLALVKRRNLLFIDPLVEKQSPGAGDDNRLDAVYQYVLGHFSDELTTKQAASLACMQEAAFCRYFKRRAKKTFSQFVNTVRITHATHLLTQESSVSAICYASGFSNVSYFNRQFKAIMGTSPLEYRKTLREEAK
ncbi:AraC family transcriptional regulator [Hymenobacter monticola]|uniref:AraC family transcriptional regulator n=1 Tax=Hymenobacter monticola TaxID=1705399 RepID=A0ABY4BEF1_9BACT|nr:AraC family transcriptional regulator [Hymenobacter monticola]UOE36386.1 AraC family transcriptional regulator [Hymenobacter monticola]